MIIKSTDIGNTIFSDDQKELINLYKKQIDEKIKNYYVEGEKIDVIPEPYPNYNWKEKYPIGCDEKVVNEIIRKYTEAGWSIKWVFIETSEISGDWTFVLKKNDYANLNFIGKSLKISFPYKDYRDNTANHSLIVPIIGVCNTKVTTPDLVEDNIEYLNFCIPTNFYITESEIIKFVRYYKSDDLKGTRWEVWCQKISSEAAVDYLVSKGKKFDLLEDVLIEKDLKIEII